MLFFDFFCFFFSSRRRHTRFALVSWLGDVYKRQEPALAVASPRLESTASPPGTFAALVALADRQAREVHLPSAFEVRLTVADPLRVGSEEVDLVQIGRVRWVLEVELRVVEFALGVHLRAGRRPIVRPAVAIQDREGGRGRASVVVVADEVHVE